MLKDNPSIYYDDQAFVDLYLADINASIEEVFGVAGFYPKSINVTGSNGVTKTLSVNAQFLKERRIVVYGSPQDVKDLGYTNDLSSQGHHRYLGFDRDSTLVTNPRFARSSAAKEFKPNDMVWNLSRTASYIAKGVISESDNITKTIGTSHQARVIAGTIKPNAFSYNRVVDSGRTTINLRGLEVPLTDFISEHIAFSAVLINYYEGMSARDFFNDYGILVPEARKSLIIDGDRSF